MLGPNVSQGQIWRKEYPLEDVTLDETFCDFIPAIASFTSMKVIKKYQNLKNSVSSENNTRNHLKTLKTY